MRPIGEPEINAQMIVDHTDEKRDEPENNAQMMVDHTDEERESDDSVDETPEALDAAKCTSGDTPVNENDNDDNDGNVPISTSTATAQPDTDRTQSYTDVVQTQGAKRPVRKAAAAAKKKIVQWTTE